MSLKLGLRNKIRRSRAGGFTGLLDQPFASGATAAYSLRRLKSSATKAVRVREDNGNTEIDIGFSGGTLDETALLNHVGSNNGFVTKWYDQSGNGNDASNATASQQPQIVTSGSVVKENGKPAIAFDGSDDILVADNVIQDLDGDLSIFYVLRVLRLNSSGESYFDNNYHGSGGEGHFESTTSTEVEIKGRWDSDGNYRVVRNNHDFANKNGIVTSIFNSSETYIKYNNNTKSAYTPTLPYTHDPKISFGNGTETASSRNSQVNYQECILYEEDKSSNDDQIINAQNNHYLIF